MILDGIALTDFGLYAGRQEIDLAPPAPGKPIVLFGGLNGGGKTTLLDALQLVFFGSRAKTSSRGRLGYADYLSRCIHDKATNRRAAIQLTFRHTIAGAEDRYTLRRAWCEEANGKCREEFRVLKNDRLAPALADNWVAQVDNLLPYNIAHLFLFDGEQIERYAAPEEAATLIGTAIQNLLGLDLVEQLDKDIRVYERRKSAERLDDGSRAQVLTVEEELDRLHDRIAAVNQQRAALRTHNIEPRRRELHAIEDEFRRLGGDLFERRREVEQALEDAAAGLSDCKEALRHLAAGSLPLLIVVSIADSAAQRDREEQDTQRALQIDQHLTGRDEGILRHLRGHGVPESTLAGLRDHLAADRAANRAVAERGTVLDLSPEARAALGVFRHVGFRALADEAAGFLAQHAHLSAKAQEAKALHDSLPDADTLGDVVGRREAVAEEIARREAQHALLGEEAEGIRREIERQEKVLAGLLEADTRHQERRDDRDRILRCSPESAVPWKPSDGRWSSGISPAFERLVLDSYQQLLRKTSLVTRLSIDPQTFSLELHTRSGAPLRTENLSAGERQLLGIALLWGLAKASGRPLPTAIDTPLGRLDTSHRTHFVERYLPFASHQTLVFSTDEEIVGGYLERLRPWIGRSYRLQYNDDDGLTRVVPGYFGTESINAIEQIHLSQQAKDQLGRLKRATGITTWNALCRWALCASLAEAAHRRRRRSRQTATSR